MLDTLMFITTLENINVTLYTMNGSSCQKDGVMDHQKIEFCELCHCAFIDEKVEILDNTCSGILL